MRKVWENHVIKRVLSPRHGEKGCSCCSPPRRSFESGGSLARFRTVGNGYSKQGTSRIPGPDVHGHGIRKKEAISRIQATNPCVSGPCPRVPPTTVEPMR